LRLDGFIASIVALEAGTYLVAWII